MKTFYDLMKLNVRSSMRVFFHLISIQAFGHLDPCRRVRLTLLFPKSLHPPSSCENVNTYRSSAWSTILVEWTQLSTSWFVDAQQSCTCFSYLHAQILFII